MTSFRNFVESGRFDELIDRLEARLKYPTRYFVAFAVGYFAYAIVRMFQ